MTYHLRRFAPLRFAVLAAVLVPMLWIGFRRGGTEVGDQMGLRAIARYWTVLTPITVTVLVPLLGTVWRLRTLRRSWAMAQPSRSAMARDGLANLVAGYLPFVAIVMLLFAFLAARVAPSASTYATIAVVTLVGPLAGGYLVFAIGYLAALWSSSGGVRVAVVILLSVLDATNWLPIVSLSVSGTSSAVLRADGWNSHFRTESASVVTPTAGFLIARAAVCAAVTALVAWTIWRQSADRDEAA